jgi:hypothetical protein
MRATLYGMPSSASVPVSDGRHAKRGTTKEPVVDGCKRCTKCLRLKPLIGFPSDPLKPHGRRSMCRMCKADRLRQWRRDTNRNERAIHVDKALAELGL